MIPNKGALICYRKRGNTEWKTSRCKLLWKYDNETIADLEDGASIITAFGDEWYDAPQLPRTDNEIEDRGMVDFFGITDVQVLSNFSSFRLHWCGFDFDTSEHAYQWSKFDGEASHHPEIKRLIRCARSAYEAFKIAEKYKACRRTEWDGIKLNVMSNILRAKVQQHEYVHRKLLATGDRELIENSWRDDFWGWGQNRDGKNMFGKLWMEIRTELRMEKDRSIPENEATKP